MKPVRALVRVEPGPIGTAPPMAGHAMRFLQWFRYIRRRSENTIAAYRQDLQSFLRFCDKAGLDDPGRITTQMIEAYTAWLMYEHKLSGATANRHRSALRMFFTYLTREGVTPRNPVAETFAAPTPKRLPKYLSIPEQEHVLAALAEDDTALGRRDLAIAAVGFFAGLRCAEIAHLRLLDVDLDARILRVNQGKGAKDRELPIITRLRAILERWLEARTALLAEPIGEMYRRTPTSPWRLRFPGPDGDVRLNTHTYSETKAAAILDKEAPRRKDNPWLFIHAAPRHSYNMRRAGQPLLTRSLFAMVRRKVTPLIGRKVSPHVLRHSFGHRLHERGGDLQLIQQSMGHSSITTTVIYSHMTNQRQRDELERLLGEGA